MLQNEDSCPQAVQVTADGNPEAKQAKAKVSVTGAKSQEKIDKYRRRFASFWLAFARFRGFWDVAKGSFGASKLAGASLEVVPRMATSECQG